MWERMQAAREKKEAKEREGERGLDARGGRKEDLEGLALAGRVLVRSEDPLEVGLVLLDRALADLVR